MNPEIIHQYVVSNTINAAVAAGFSLMFFIVALELWRRTKKIIEEKSKDADGYMIGVFVATLIAICLILMALDYFNCAITPKYHLFLKLLK